MGFDRNPKSSDIIKATIMGIQTVLKESLAALADVMTGAIIKATTAGRIPIKIDEITRLFLIMSGVKKIAIVRIIRKEGRIVPAAATIPPRVPRNLSPTAVAIFTASIPGKDWATASRSRKSSLAIHLWRSTISRSIMEIIAHPPPKVNAPILKNEANNFRYIFFSFNSSCPFCARHTRCRQRQME